MTNTQNSVKIQEYERDIKNINDAIKILGKNNFFSECNANPVYDILTKERQNICQKIKQEASQ